jgi:hypothetical protein
MCLERHRRVKHKPIHTRTNARHHVTICSQVSKHIEHAVRDTTEAHYRNERDVLRQPTYVWNTQSRMSLTVFSDGLITIPCAHVYVRIYTRTRAVIGVEITR